MILTSGRLRGREAVVEYSPTVSWKSWGIEREGAKDVFIFCGKFSLVYTNHCAEPSSFGRKAVIAVLAALLAKTATKATGVELPEDVIEYVVNRWGSSTGPH